jgi:hypothetical protein
MRRARQEDTAMQARYTPLRPISQVLADAKRIFLDGFGRCWVLSLLGAVLLSVAEDFWSRQVGQVSDGSTAAGTLDDLDPTAALNQLAGYASPAALRAGLVVVVVALLVYGALIARLHALASPGQASTQLQALITALRRLPGSVLAAILWTLALAVGLVLLIVPGFYWSGRLQLWLPAMLVEDVGAIDSLRSSWTLTRHQWWRSTTVLTLALIIISVLALIVDALTSGVAALVSAPLHFGTRAVAFNAALFDLLADVLLLPMLPAALLAIYDDLKQLQSQSESQGGSDG